MSSGSGPKWALDETSLLLGSLVLVVYLYNYLNLPTPDCHPALLANQASFSPTHLKNETPIVRHKSTYFSTPLATSPNREWQTLNHLLKDVETKNFDFLGNLTRGQITWLSSKNLLTRSKALGSGIKQKFPQAENLIILGDNDVHSLSAILSGFQYGLKVITLKHNIVPKHTILNDILKENPNSLIFASPRNSEEVLKAYEFTGAPKDNLVWLASSLDSYENLEGLCSSDIEVSESQILQAPEVPAEFISYKNYFFNGANLLKNSEFKQSAMLAGLAGTEYILPIQTKIQPGTDSYSSNMWLGSPSVLFMVLYCLHTQVKYCPIPLESNPVDHDETPFQHLFTYLQKFQPSVLQLSQPVLAHIYFHLRINTYKTSMFSNLFLSPLLKNNVDLLKKGHLSNSFSDKTVFSAVREQLGGKVRLIFAENTQIPNSQLNVIRVALSSQIIPYYNFDYVFGWTLLASSFDYENRDYALAGSPIGHLEVKLRNSNISPLKVQDEPYPRGELLIRSSGLSSNVELIEDGWYPTNTFFEMEHSGAFKYLGNTFELIPTDGPNSPDFMGLVSSHYLSNRYVLDVKLEHLPHNALPVVDFDMSLSGLASTARYQGLRLKVIPRVEALPGLVQAQYKLTDGSGLPAVEELLLEELIHVAREKKLPRALWPSRVKLITLEDAVGHI